MSKQDGGWLIPEQLARQIQDQWRDNSTVFDVLLPPRVRKPLTRWQRIRIFWISAKWRLHDWLFPDCSQGDDW